LLHIEGLGRQLYPELDLWQTAKPYLENWLKQNYSPKALLKETIKRAPSWLEKLPKVPDMMVESLQQAPRIAELAASQLEQQQTLKQLQQQQDSTRRRGAIAAIAIACAVVVSQPTLMQQISQLPIASGILLLIAVVCLLRR
jgi:ubiquinone biosynthesis protein